MSGHGMKKWAAQLIHGAAAYSTLTTGSSALFPSPRLNDGIEFSILRHVKVRWPGRRCPAIAIFRIRAPLTSLDSTGPNIA
jgi:hypothetical protein